MPQNASPKFPEKYYQDPLGIDRYVIQEKTLFEWKAPSKIEKKRNSSESAQIILVIVFCLLVLLLLKEFVLAVVFGVFVFLCYVMVASKPTFLSCSVTTLGIKIEERYFFWNDISQFWIEQKGDQFVLYFRSVFPSIQIHRLVLQLGDEEEIRTKIGTYLLYKKPTQTMLEKTLKNIREQLPFDLDFLQM